MNFISSITPYIKNFPILGSLPALVGQVTALVNNYFTPEKLGEFIHYEDYSAEKKLLSSTKVHLIAPSSTHTKFQKHKSFEDLCKFIVLQRNPKAAKNLDKEASNASFSAVNRADLKTEVTFSKELKKLLGLQGKSDTEISRLFSIESNYKHNSDFNGHSYVDKEGKIVKIDSAILSSFDRNIETGEGTQNLSVVKTGGDNLFYTGRPDTLGRAKEQALFALSSKLKSPPLQEASSSDVPSDKKPTWIQRNNGLTWNPQTKCIEFPYAVYSVMSDSNLMYYAYSALKAWANNEKLFLQKEINTLKELSKNPILVKDASGNVFRLQCKPILLSQGFNSFSSWKELFMEGSLSPTVMREGWTELKGLLEKQPKQAKNVASHIAILDDYFKARTRLSSLHLFLHMNIVLSELSGVNESLPLIMHCKSSTDRTGIGAGILATLKQFKDLKIPIPSNLDTLTKDERFKELFAANWIPTWHQRSKYSRDVAGISFGSDMRQNPILLECLPERYLKESTTIGRWIGSGLFAGCNAIGLGTYYTLYALTYKIPLFTASYLGYVMGLAPSPVPNMIDRLSVFYNSLSFSYYPKTFLNEKANEYRSKSSAPSSPLEKQKKA